ncbi:hypothetical protein GCM10023170_010740 [Phytohabitans houttuyneae]|uniref:Uncharacterized protein n=1 Tax=Phytohabitans houttuyneae TaxID=1076126 RepID=A0A6V8K6S6_9ACTN|nr:hypothetical protein Phou_036440 [Phytohabitans houttuyneae]
MLLALLLAAAVVFALMAAFDGYGRRATWGWLAAACVILAVWALPAIDAAVTVT